MDDEPPPGYVAFVVTRVDGLRREADRLVGGDPEVVHLYLDVLADVAGRWRRLCWWARRTGRDAAGDYLHRRLADRARRWREERGSEVDIRVLRPSRRAAPRSSAALRLGPVLPDTVRDGAGPLADAGIAWVTAYRRQQWYRAGRRVAAAIVLVGGLIQGMSWLASGS